MQNSRVTAQTRPLYPKTYRHKQKTANETDNIRLFRPTISSHLCSVYYIILNILPNAKFNFIDYCPKTVIS